MTLPYLPIWAVDFLGAVLMIVLSFLSVRLARELNRRDEKNVIATYLLWFCYALMIFAVSRSAGHILKQLLLISGYNVIWEAIRPFSGSINTVLFVVVASITLFFDHVSKIYQQILKDQENLKAAHKELLYLNTNLEHLVAERTEALVLSEKKYRSIFEVSRDMILVTDLNGDIVDLNPAGYTILGVETANLEKKNFQAFFAVPKDWERLLGNTLTDGYVLNTELELKRLDGRHLRALISSSLGRAPQGQAETIHFLVKDVEQLRQMREQMVQADKLASIGQLSAGIAHEINNPLGIILGYTQLLLRGEKKESERYGDLKTIEKHVRHCKSIVKDLLNFARSSKTEREIIQINDTIEEVLNFVQQHSASDHVSITRRYDPAIPEVLIDEKKMRQVLLNLFMNAKHAVGDSGEIRVSTEFEPKTGQVVIRVADTGYGIEKKNLSRIFDPFFTTKSTGEGTGLGLSVSYGIIKSHGGDIRVESSPGKGSSFAVVLPPAAAKPRKT